jgi:hypothetical protein
MRDRPFVILIEVALLLCLGLAAMIAAICVCAPGLTSQQMIWLVPFLIVDQRPRSLLAYTAVSILAWLSFMPRTSRQRLVCQQSRKVREC